ncbi:MAG: sporulation protein YqfD [Clostridia bacterium]|nr:sporulation protein YqfD [Clostridia bacterium]
MNRIIRSILGSYTLSLPKEKAPDLFNLCKEKGVFFFAPVAEDDKVYVKVSLFSCKAFVELAESLEISAEITERKGLPFLVSRYRKRYGIYIGIILSAAFMLFSSMHIWEINITGNQNIKKEEILKILALHGIRVGTFIPDIDADLTAEYILLEYSPLSSLAINVKGTVATVDVIERVKKPESEFAEDGYCNLVAEEDGIITNVIAAEGHPEIKIGDVVTGGQLLVNGIVENRYGAFKIVNAKGYVYADVYKDIEFDIPLSYSGKEYTGKEKTKREIYIIGFPVKLYRTQESPFELCDITAVEENLEIFGLKLPVKVSKAVYREYVTVEYQITEQEAKTKAEKALALWWEKEAGGEIVSIDEETSIKNNVYCLKAHVVINKNIAVRQEIKFNYPNKPF